MTDQLLVTGKKPYSLAKFLSTSLVFRKTVGDAQVNDEIAFVRNFGWAPQRFNSRAKPYAREARRWKVIFGAVATEAAGENKERRILARLFMEELGGEHSSRLLLGGMLADLSAEHYTWVAEGDKKNPETTAVMERANAFLARLTALYDESLILSLPDTFTGVTLKFLKETSYYRYGRSVQTIGIGDWENDASARNTIKEALGRMRCVVANIREFMKFYRAEHSWLHAFTAFRLPSPMSASAAAGSAAYKEVEASLQRISREANLPEAQTLSELPTILARAEVHLRNGCSPRESWGRASAEWPELKCGRGLVECYLIWKSASGNLERRFRRFREIRCPERAQLLDVSVENCMLVEQAPPSKMLREWADACKNTSYFQRCTRLHRKLCGEVATRKRVAQRRDAGVPRNMESSTQAPDTEAAFGRKRAAAMAEVEAASPSKRARMLSKAPLGLARVAQEAAQASKHTPAAASASVVATVAKRDAAAEGRNLRGAAAAAKARATREKKVFQSATQPRQGREEDLAAPLKPGIMLVRFEDEEARQKARQWQFHSKSDPVEFVAKVARVPVSARKGHVVLAPAVDTDYALSAKIVAALMGCFFATPKDFLTQGEFPRGIMYTEKYKRSRQSFHVAVSASLANELPTLPPLLKAIAQAPGSCFNVYGSERELCKFLKKAEKTAPRMRQRTFVLAKPRDRDAADAKYQELYITPQSFLLKFDASARAVCPGPPIGTAARRWRKVS